MKAHGRLLLTCALLAGGFAPAAERSLPPRPADAPGGAAVAAKVESLDRAAREEFIVAEILRGNVPESWRKFVPVPVVGGMIEVASDYLAVGSDVDYLLTPLTPASAQRVADALDCILPTTKMADAIWRAAAVKLEPSPIPPSEAMTSARVMAEHSATVAAQRRAMLAQHPLGQLVAGHKKDVVLTPQLAAAPGHVAIYGWHRSDGIPIQPLFTKHTEDWVDYSHGVRLVRRVMTFNGSATTVDAVLADDARWTALSDEGPISAPRHGALQPVLPATWAGETWQSWVPETGVRVLLNQPAAFEAARPVRLALYALPAGNTIEQTAGRTLAPGDDWHFDIQHIAAQTRWLRREGGEPNLVVAYLECAEHSWVLWRRKQPDAGARIVKLVDGLMQKFPAARIALTGHSAGGTLIFGYLDAVAAVPERVERIAFLDSNYAYDATHGHDAKLAGWLAGGTGRVLSVLAYEDYRARVDGKTFVSAEGGTWGRSRAMLADLGRRFAFTRSNEPGGLQRHTALDGRVEFLLLENPGQKVWHTRLVELNGFCQAMLAGTPAAGHGYRYLGDRAYGAYVLPARN